MRSLASELKRRSVAVAIGDPRSLQKVYRLLDELKLTGLVEVGTKGVEVPALVLQSGDPALFACWLALTLEAERSVLLGVDFGVRNLGFAAIVGGLLAYSCVLKGTSRLLRIVTVLVELGVDTRVRIGCSGPLTNAARRLAERLERAGSSVKLLHDERVKENVVVGDFTSLGKLSKHELDALKIALAPPGDRGSATH